MHKKLLVTLQSKGISVYSISTVFDVLVLSVNSLCTCSFMLFFYVVSLLHGVFKVSLTSISIEHEAAYVWRCTLCLEKVTPTYRL